MIVLLIPVAFGGGFFVVKGVNNFVTAKQKMTIPANSNSISTAQRRGVRPCADYPRERRTSHRS